MMEASKCIFFGKLGGFLIQENPEVVIVTTLELHFPAGALLSLQSQTFTFFLSFNWEYLLTLQFMSVATWTHNSLTAGGFFFPSVKPRGAKFLPAPEGVSFAQEIGKVLFSSVSSLSLECKY